MEQIAQWRIIREKYNPLPKYSYIITMMIHDLTPIQKEMLKINPDLKGVIDMFNILKHCNCCERHYCNKPLDITDDRTPYGYPKGDSRNWTGPVGGVENEDIIHFATPYKDSKKPVIETFRNDSERCVCDCRSKMRVVVRSNN